MCYCCHLQVLAHGHSHLHVDSEAALDHKAFAEISKLDPCSPQASRHDMAVILGFEAEKRKSQYNSRQTVFFRLDGKLQPCPKMGLKAYCAAWSVTSGRATVGLKQPLCDRPQWQSCSWLIMAILSLSHHAMHQMPLPFTILALYALYAPCVALSSRVLEFLRIQTTKWFLDKELDSASTLYLYCIKGSISHSISKPYCIMHCVILSQKDYHPKIQLNCIRFHIVQHSRVFEGGKVSSLTSYKWKNF